MFMMCAQESRGGLIVADLFVSFQITPKDSVESLELKLIKWIKVPSASNIRAKPRNTNLRKVSLLSNHI